MTLHIYLDYTTEQKMQEIRQKYKVSLSTIVDVCLNNMQFLFLTEDEKYNEKIKNTYLTQNIKHQTCIRLNRENKEHFIYTWNLTPNDLSKISSNLLYIVATNYKYFNEHGYSTDRIKMNINNELAKKREIYWDYNKTYRQHVRAQKQYRKEYETE